VPVLVVYFRLIDCSFSDSACAKSVFTTDHSSVVVYHFVCLYENYSIKTVSMK